MKFYCEKCKKTEELPDEKVAWKNGWDFLLIDGKIYNFCPDCPSGPTAVEKFKLEE